MEQKKWNRNDRRPPVRRAQEPAENAENMLEGRNAVQEALAAGHPIDKLYIAAGETDRALSRLAAMAREAGAAVVETDRRKLDQLSATGAHQGVIAMVAAHAYATVEEILENAKSRGEAPLIVICDELSDPHNLGAIIRTAECAGAHGVIIPKRRSVGLTAVVGKASAGALEYLPVARVANLVSAIRELQKAGVWVFGTAADGDTALYQADLKGPAAIVIGNEGDGMSRLVAEACDCLGTVTIRCRILPENVRPHFIPQRVERRRNFIVRGCPAAGIKPSFRTDDSVRPHSRQLLDPHSKSASTLLFRCRDRCLHRPLQSEYGRFTKYGAHYGTNQAS